MSRKEIEEKIAEISRLIEIEFKQRLFDEIITPELLLRNDSNTRVGDQRWYKEVPFDALIALLGKRIGIDSMFPIATNCAYWFNTEIDLRNKLPFRFFFEKAWINREIPAKSKILKITVPHKISPAALESFSVSINNEPLSRLSGEKGMNGIDVVYFNMKHIKEIGKSNEISFFSAVSGVPALTDTNSKDWRRLSIAICEPEFLACMTKK
jgi:hypothetical protein